MPAVERLLLDTHVWKDVLDDRDLSARIARRINAASAAGMLYISAITPWEIAMLVQKGALRLGAPTASWVVEAIRNSGVRVAALEPVVAVDAAESWDLHGDPADRIIVATARALGACLVTRDRKIIEYAVRTKNVRVVEPS